MIRPMPAPQLLNRDFLEIRAKILEIAASLDRLDRGEGTVDEDPRTTLIQKGLTILASAEPGRAERVQLLFSQPFHDDWRKQFGI